MDSFKSLGFGMVVVCAMYLFYKLAGTDLSSTNIFEIYMYVIIISYLHDAQKHRDKHEE